MSVNEVCSKLVTYIHYSERMDFAHVKYITSDSMQSKCGIIAITTCVNL